MNIHIYGDRAQLIQNLSEMVEACQTHSVDLVWVSRARSPDRSDFRYQRVRKLLPNMEEVYCGCKS